MESAVPRTGDIRDGLLHREDPQTPYPEDARHWIAIYREMVAFTLGLVERGSRSSRGRCPAAPAELLPRTWPSSSSS